MEFDLELFLQLNEEWASRPLVRQPPATSPDGLARTGRNRAASLERQLGVRGKRVLELGCGRGYLTRTLSDEYDCDSLGIDIQPYDVWDQRCIQGDIADPPDIGTFDLIVSYAVWEHVEHPYSALENKRRLLRPDGVAYMIANLHRGPKASHRYRQVFFPWPHLLFTDDIFESYYKQIGRQPMKAAWVNRLTFLHYLYYFDRIGFGLSQAWTSTPWWDEEFYRRFEDTLGRYPKWDLQHDFIHAILTRDAVPGQENWANPALSQRLLQLERQLGEANHRLDLVHASTSWRVTAPLRAVGRLRRRLVG